MCLDYQFMSLLLCSFFLSHLSSVRSFSTFGFRIWLRWFARQRQRVTFGREWGRRMGIVLNGWQVKEVIGCTAWPWTRSCVRNSCMTVMMEFSKQPHTHTRLCVALFSDKRCRCHSLCATVCDSLQMIQNALKLAFFVIHPWNDCDFVWVNERMCTYTSQAFPLFLFLERFFQP